jgi:hypothetical protein
MNPELGREIVNKQESREVSYILESSRKAFKDIFWPFFGAERRE